MRQACLCLVEQRETRYRVQWYYRLFESTQRGLARNQSNEVVHGSMLALGELLRHTGAHEGASPMNTAPPLAHWACNRQQHTQLKHSQCCHAICCLVRCAL